MKENMLSPVDAAVEVHRPAPGSSATDARSGGATEAGSMRSPADGDRIMHQRALALAREPEDAAIAETHLAVIEFVLHGERYCVESQFVREVHVLRDLTPVPGTPDFVLGILNVRGQILAVLDLARILGVAPVEDTPPSRAVLLHAGSMEFAVPVDAVLGARAIDAAAVQPVPRHVDGSHARYLRGVTAESIGVLDVEALLRDPALVVNDTSPF